MNIPNQNPQQPDGYPVPNLPTTRDTPDMVQQQAARATSGVGQQGGGTLFTEPVLVVNQKAKLIEVHNEYAIYNQSGQQVGAVRQVGQSIFRKVLRFVSKVDQFLTHRLEIVDAQGQTVLQIVRPAKIFKSRFEVSGPQGVIGEIVQKNVFGKIRFSLEVSGQEVGSLNAENWRAWNFNIQDANGNEVARITKTFAGLLKAAFTTGDNYVVEFSQPVQGPLQALVLASALSIDTALKQDSR